LWHSTMMGIQQRNYSPWLNWTRKSEVSTTADMSISDYHYCPPKDDGYTDRVLCRYLHSSIKQHQLNIL
jgi:hypothetical protein